MIWTLHDRCRSGGHFRLQFGCVLLRPAICVELGRYTRREAIVGLVPAAPHPASFRRAAHHPAAGSAPVPASERPGRAGPRPSGSGGAREGQKPRTRVALRTRFGPRIPHDINPGADPLRGRRHLLQEFEPAVDPAAVGGDRGPRLLLLHQAAAAEGQGGPGRPRARGSKSGTRCRRSVASSAPCSKSTATATRS